jgi:hypothetical protein
MWERARASVLVNVSESESECRRKCERAGVSGRALSQREGWRDEGLRGVAFAGFAAPAAFKFVVVVVTIVTVAAASAAAARGQALLLPPLPPLRLPPTLPPPPTPLSPCLEFGKWLMFKLSQYFNGPGR